MKASTLPYQYLSGKKFQSFCMNFFGILHKFLAFSHFTKIVVLFLLAAALDCGCLIMTSDHCPQQQQLCANYWWLLDSTLLVNGHIWGQSEDPPPLQHETGVWSLESGWIIEVSQKRGSRTSLSSEL